MNPFRSSPKNGMFSMTGYELQKRYAEAVMSDDTKTADDARTIGLQLGLTLDTIAADLRASYEVKLRFEQLREAVALANSAEADEPKWAKEFAAMQDKVAAYQTKMNAAQNELLRINNLRTDASNAKRMADRIEREHPRLFGRTPIGNEGKASWME